MKPLSLCLTTFLPSILLIASLGLKRNWVEASTTRSQYGEPCNRTQRCDSKSFLNCDAENETCVCLRPDEMLFDPDTGKCGTKTGEECKFLIETGDGEIAYRFQPCVEAAICQADGYCGCGPYYNETINGTCSPSLEQQYGEPCDTKLKCSPISESGLRCDRGICNCNFASEYSPQHDQCVGLGGLHCIQGSCTNHSSCNVEDNICECNPGYFQDREAFNCKKQFQRLSTCQFDDQCENVFPFLQLTCVSGRCECDPEVSLFATVEDKGTSEVRGQCVGKEGQPCIEGLCAQGNACSHDDKDKNSTGICTCQLGYTPNAEGKCAIGFGGKCESAEMCHEGFVCKNNNCSCKYSDMQIYSETKGKCVSLAGGPCSVTSSCTDHATCSSGSCSCSPSYVKSLKGTCELKYGMSCSTGDVCDSFANLVCTNGRCRCNYYGLYNDEVRKCLRYVESQCMNISPEHLQVECPGGVTSGGPSNSVYGGNVYCTQPNLERECVLGAYCKRINAIEGVCTCRSGFSTVQTTGDGKTCKTSSYYG